MLPMVEARISDEGEIQVRGGMCMKGYHNNLRLLLNVLLLTVGLKTQDIGTITTINKMGKSLLTSRLLTVLKTLL